MRAGWAKRRYVIILTIMLALLYPLAAEAAQSISILITQSENWHQHFNVRVRVGNDGLTAICLDRYFLTASRLSVTKNGRKFRVAQKYSWEGRPRPGCAVLNGMSSQSADFDLNDIFPHHSFSGAKLCYSLRWGTGNEPVNLPNGASRCVVLK